jgi:hypothetical protein
MSGSIAAVTPPDEEVEAPPELAPPLELVAPPELVLPLELVVDPLELDVPLPDAPPEVDVPPVQVPPEVVPLELEPLELETPPDVVVPLEPAAPLEEEPVPLEEPAVPLELVVVPKLGPPCSLPPVAHAATATAHAAKMVVRRRCAMDGSSPRLGRLIKAGRRCSASNHHPRARSQP